MEVKGVCNGVANGFSADRNKWTFVVKMLTTVKFFCRCKIVGRIVAVVEDFPA